MTPLELKEELRLLLKSEIQDPVLILGESGIGKTSIVRQVVSGDGGEVWDIRWSQLMPADARGVPVPQHKTDGALGTTVFYPPSFWPREGKGVIFLDEFNMAKPAMMGLAQQLLLDRRFGDYAVPRDIVVWAAGNRQIDRAAVNEVPGPVCNRVAHYEVEHDLDSFEVWAHGDGDISPKIVGFIKWRSELLHKFDPDKLAWPSPRSWEMADRRFKKEMSIAPVVGQAACDEFEAHLEMLEKLPSIDRIADGRGQDIPFPEEVSLKYATSAELIRRSLNGFQTFVNCFRWASTKAEEEPDWVSFFCQDYVRLLRATKKQHEARTVLLQLTQMPELSRYIQEQQAAGGLV